MKKTSKNHISEEAAVDLLSRLFVNHPDRSQLSLDELYIAAGRADRDTETNRNWLNGVLAKLKRYSLIDTDMKFENKRNRLVGIKLTMAGYTALHRTPPTHPRALPTEAKIVSKTDEVTYNDVAKAVRIFRDNNPEFEVIFSVKLKESVPMD